MSNSQNLSRRLNESGFTLLELMMAITIAGILATVALPSMNYAIDNSRVRTATTDTHMALLMARSEAIKRNASVILDNSGGGWNNGWCVRTLASTNCATNALTVQDPFPGATIECYANGVACGSTLTFRRSGRATTSIEFRAYNSANLEIPMRCVRVSLSGRPGVTLDTNSDPTDGCN